jgi:hypothetical protein
MKIMLIAIAALFSIDFNSTQSAGRVCAISSVPITLETPTRVAGETTICLDVSDRIFRGSFGDMP